MAAQVFIPRPVGTPLDTSSFFTGACGAYAQIEAIAAGSTVPRALIVGTAGAGKSTLLVQLQDLLIRQGTPVSVSGNETRIEDVPSSEVLIVDDPHLLDVVQLDAIRVRAADPNAALVLASRPWPRPPRLVDIWRPLESSAPPILLGRVSRPEVLTYLAGLGRAISPDCLDELLDVTAGVAWLVSRVLAMHDEQACGDDPNHVELRRALEAQVMHRLDAIDEPLRRLLERISLGDPGALQGDVDAADELVEQGHTEGLLLRNGSPLPIVRSAVRASLPPHRVVALGTVAADGIARTAAESDPSFRTWVGRIGDSRIGAALAAHADRLLDSDPPQAQELYRAATTSGHEATGLTLRQALAAWGAGDLDTASGFVDVALAGTERAQLTEIAHTSAAVWSARGLMVTGSDVYAALPQHEGVSAAKAAIAHVGAGRIDRLAPAASTADDDLAEGPAQGGIAVLPSTLGTAMLQLESGLRSTLERGPSSATLTHLVRASELYTSSHATDPLPEVPAVITAIVAIGAGDLTTARRVIDAAVNGGQAGVWARRRLLLWQSWLAIQGERPAEARTSLSRAEEIPYPCSPRDELLRQTVVVTLARRYEDVQSLESTWLEARESIRHIDIDVYMLVPLSSLVCAAARVGDASTLAPHLDRGLEILRQLGSPPLWTAHLNWAGVQQGILLNRPDALGPYARALVAASPHSELSETMAHAGRVWASVLAGSVDAAAVEAAARSLASVGLAWDGARLAGHGAGRTDDRKVAASLLSCARELHPPDAGRRAAPAAEPVPTAAVEPGEQGQDLPQPQESQLSDRELDVARLVLQGKTYVEIGEMIFISPRTVEHHVARIRRRLAATSRSDLIAKLRLTIGSSVGRAVVDVQQVGRE
jgi:DNA-binding CsgD family transcriptional regulator/energy-coupling factor transporter ATP-binding protein EcfA2